MKKTTETTTATSSAIDQLKKLHSAQAIERKDISLEKYLAKNADENGHATIAIAGFMSKHIPKYEKAELGQRGFFTMLYNTDGVKIGAFSNALFEFATFFYSKAPGYDENGKFYKWEFTEGDMILVDVSEVNLDGGRSTYNFELLSGVLDHKVNVLFDPAQAGNLLGITSSNLLTIDTPDAVPGEAAE